MVEFEQDRDLLIRLWRMWAKRAAELSDEQWAAETRLPGWTVRDIYMHVTPDVMITMLADPVAAEPMHAQLAEIVREMSSLPCPIRAHSSR